VTAPAGVAVVSFTQGFRPGPAVDPIVHRIRAEKSRLWHTEERRAKSVEDGAGSVASPPSNRGCLHTTATTPHQPPRARRCPWPATPPRAFPSTGGTQATQVSPPPSADSTNSTPSPEATAEPAEHARPGPEPARSAQIRPGRAPPPRTSSSRRRRRRRIPHPQPRRAQAIHAVAQSHGRAQRSTHDQAPSRLWPGRAPPPRAASSRRHHRIHGRATRRPQHRRESISRPSWGRKRPAATIPGARAASPASPPAATERGRQEEGCYRRRRLGFPRVARGGRRGGSF
jgi:hypothetical protein